MTPKTLLSFEDFAALPDDGMKHELNEAELISTPPPKPHHGDCQARLAASPHQFVSSHGLGRVFTESGHRPTPGTVRGPDLSFVSKTRLQNPDEYFEGGPEAFSFQWGRLSSKPQEILLCAPFDTSFS